MRVLVFLFGAALLEAGGDALIRVGLGHRAVVARAGWIAAGAAVLTAYGLLVNRPGWDFGRLMGAYVAVFFVTAQVIGVVLLRRPVSLPIVAGGSLIVAGGLVVALWQAP